MARPQLPRSPEEASALGVLQDWSQAQAHDLITLYDGRGQRVTRVCHEVTTKERWLQDGSSSKGISFGGGFYGADFIRGVIIHTDYREAPIGTHVEIKTHPMGTDWVAGVITARLVDPDGLPVIVLDDCLAIPSRSVHRFNIL